MALILMFKKIALSLCFTLFLGLLTACGPNGITRLKNTESTDLSSPEAASENTDSEPKSDANAAKDERIGAPVALPPSLAGETAPGADASAALPGMQPLKGVNVDDLFSQDIKNTDERFDRLENAVKSMMKEFESVKPSIVRLAAVEADIQSLVKEMEVMLQETPTADTSATAAPEALLQVDQLDPQPVSPLIPPQTQAQAPPSPMAPQNVLKLPADYGQEKPAVAAPQTPTPQIAPAPKAPVQPKAPAAAPKPKVEGLAATAVRVGEHTDKIRVVMDVTQEAKFSIDLDNAEKLLVVEMPDVAWAAARAQKFSDSALFESYSVEPTNGGKGSLVVFTLKRSTDILKQSTLRPDGGNGHRIYFDLKL